jgi:hypothetical protein
MCTKKNLLGVNTPFKLRVSIVPPPSQHNAIAIRGASKNIRKPALDVIPELIAFKYCTRQQNARRVAIIARDHDLDIQN